MNKRTRIIIVVTLVVLLCLLALFSATNKKFTLVSSSPISKNNRAATDKGISLVFSEDIDTQNPYEQFRLSPKTDGVIEVKGKIITFTPEYQLKGNTEYTLLLLGVKSERGRIERTLITFKTSEQTLSFFEKELPYVTADYTIDRLSSGAIVVTIINPPAEDNTKKALDFLKSKKIDTSKVLVQRAPSSLE